MPLDGFSSYEGDAIMWIVYHSHGSTIVHARTEAMALARFMARYPDYTVSEIRRA